MKVNMSWNVVSMGLFFPITQAIGMGFRRREQALSELGALLGAVQALWNAIHSWKIQDKEKGWVRMVEQLDDCFDGKDQVRRLFEELLTSLVVYFDHVRWRRARHVLRTWSAEQAEMMAAAHESRVHVDQAIGRIQRLVQHLKTRGLPGGEAHRLDQYYLFCLVFLSILFVQSFA